jgi:hypothetical protein
VINLPPETIARAVEVWQRLIRSANEAVFVEESWGQRVPRDSQRENTPEHITALVISNGEGTKGHTPMTLVIVSYSDHSGGDLDAANLRHLEQTGPAGARAGGGVAAPAALAPSFPGRHSRRSRSGGRGGGHHQAQAERAAAKAQVDSAPSRAVLDRAEVYAMIDSLGDVGDRRGEARQARQAVPVAEREHPLRTRRAGRLRDDPPACG